MKLPKKRLVDIVILVGAAVNVVAIALILYYFVF